MMSLPSHGAALLLELLGNDQDRGASRALECEPLFSEARARCHRAAPNPNVCYSVVLLPRASISDTHRFLQGAHLHSVWAEVPGFVLSIYTHTIPWVFLNVRLKSQRLCRVWAYHCATGDAVVLQGLRARSLTSGWRAAIPEGAPAWPPVLQLWVLEGPGSPVDRGAEVRSGWGVSQTDWLVEPDRGSGGWPSCGGPWFYPHLLGGVFQSFEGVPQRPS